MWRARVIHLQVVGRNRSSIFAYLPERVANKLKGWKGSELSVAGKEVIIKSVIQSIPIYTMSCFLIPKKICDDIEKLIRRFWWGGTEDKRKTHWVAWEKIQKSREDGGLGFKDLRDFNIALLAKHSWRFLHMPESLAGRVFKEKYFRDKSILDVELHPSSQVSFAFRSIIAGRDLLRSGLAWEIGHGGDVRVYVDKWVTRVGSYGLMSTCPVGIENVTFDYLLDAERRLWNVERIQQLFLPSDVAAICQLPIRPAPDRDRMYWTHSENGSYTVASGYRAQLIQSRGEGSSSAGHIDRPLLSKLWKLKVPKKCIFTSWRLWHSSLGVGAKFRERGMFVESSCLFCDGHDETEEHLFVNCSFTRKVWSGIHDLHFILSWDKNFKDLLIYVLSNCSTSICEKFIMIIWGLWKGRNDLRFENKNRDEHEVRNLGLDQLLWYKEARGLYGSDISESSSSAFWVAPPAGFYMINCDAAFPSCSRVMGLGSVIRDSSGNFTAGKFCRRIKSRSVLLAEVQAIWMGLQLASDLRLQHVLIQSDSLVAINLLRDGYSGKIRASEALAELNAMIHFCKDLISGFLSVSFSFISRNGNNLAHLFAQRGLVEDDMSFYFQTPDWAKDVFSADLLGLTTQV